MMFGVCINEKLAKCVNDKNLLRCYAKHGRGMNSTPVAHFDVVYIVMVMQIFFDGRSYVFLKEHLDGSHQDDRFYIVPTPQCIIKCADGLDGMSLIKKASPSQIVQVEADIGEKDWLEKYVDGDSCTVEKVGVWLNKMRTIMLSGKISEFSFNN